MAYMQCPDCKLTVPATATYLRGDQCPRCLTTMEPRDRFRAAVPAMSAPERPAPPAPYRRASSRRPGARRHYPSTPLCADIAS